MNHDDQQKRVKIQFDFIDGKISEQEAIEQFIALGVKPTIAKAVINNTKSNLAKAKYNLK